MAPRNGGSRSLRWAMLGLLAMLSVPLGFVVAALLGLATRPVPAPKAPPLVLVQPLTGVGPSQGRRRLQPSAPPPERAPHWRQRPSRWRESDEHEGALLAIVVDDLGYSLAASRALLAIGQPLTYSIIPRLAHSRQTAQLVARAGQEFIVHAPMEPADFPRQNPGEDALLRAMSERETRERLLDYFADLPGAVGLSNHMGSAYSDDAAKMALVQAAVAERRLVFLNSKTSASPVPARIAQAAGYAYLERDVFLDNERSEPAIRAELRRASERARRRGRAIAIGHPYPETLRVLAQELPSLREAGITLVPLTALLRR
ncbi:MAG: divergent polysaccharide deacetylase family protein [Candidatus Lambdaproteobacteria bacterium]|nr:divergent polysaccharide deacetylase family protein [Candidatus Lambdaproteobacteria bacterium]